MLGEIADKRTRDMVYGLGMVGCGECRENCQMTPASSFALAAKEHKVNLPMGAP